MKSQPLASRAPSQPPSGASVCRVPQLFLCLNNRCRVHEVRKGPLAREDSGENRLSPGVTVQLLLSPSRVPGGGTCGPRVPPCPVWRWPPHVPLLAPWRPGRCLQRGLSQLCIAWLFFGNLLIYNLKTHQRSIVSPRDPFRP